eukprot:6173683-Pleurochrysis_carterae.AAC.3
MCAAVGYSGLCTVPLARQCACELVCRLTLPCLCAQLSVGKYPVHKANNSSTPCSYWHPSSAHPDRSAVVAHSHARGPRTNRRCRGHRCSSAFSPCCRAVSPCCCESRRATSARCRPGGPRRLAPHLTHSSIATGRFPHPVGVPACCCCRYRPSH